MEACFFPSPNIILSIDDGPKKGETLDRRPGSFIRIGRVVRGNTIAIKDSGISEKHFTIAFHPEISRWAVTDHSSNGTILNDEFISSSRAFPLSDGDVIKIGLSTLISVKMSVPNSTLEPRTRRGRRMVAAATSPEDATQENGSSGSTKFLCNDEVLNRIAEECKARMPTRTSSAFKPVVVEGGCRSANRVVERTDRVSKKKDEGREVRQEKVDKPTKKGRKGKGHIKIGVESTGFLRKDEALGSVTVKRKMIRVEDLNQIVVEGKEGRSTSASAMACSARRTKEDVVVEENAEEPTEYPQQRRKARFNRGIVSDRALKTDKALKPVAVEGDCRSWASHKSAKILKEKDMGMEIGQQNIGRPTKNEVKRRGGLKSGVEPAKVLRKDALGDMTVERKLGQVVMASSMPSSSSVMIMEEHDGEPLKKIEGLVKDGREVMGRAKRGGASSRASRKGEDLEPLVLEGRMGRVTRASTRVRGSSAIVTEKHEEEDKENKEDKVERPAKTGRKQKARSKRVGRSTRVSRKDETLEYVPIEGKMEGMTRDMDVAVVSSFKVSKELQKNHVMKKLDLHSDDLEVPEKNKSTLKNTAGGEGEKLDVCKQVKFGFEVVGNDMTNMMSGEPNKKEDTHFPNKNELAFSWSSFSEIRGIPNTTSKYREDKLINWHATPFEERVQRAMKRGITETFAGEI